MAKNRKAGEKAANLSGYLEYINDYDRKARGEGSDKDPAVDRFSGLDVRYMHDARDEYGVDKYTAAQEVLDYADRVEGKTRMGGATEDALDALRDLLKGQGGDSAPTAPKENPNPSLEEALEDGVSPQVMDAAIRNSEYVKDSVSGKKSAEKYNDVEYKDIKEDNKKYTQASAFNFLDAYKLDLKDKYN